MNDQEAERQVRKLSEIINLIEKCGDDERVIICPTCKSHYKISVWEIIRCNVCGSRVESHCKPAGNPRGPLKGLGL